MTPPYGHEIQATHWREMCSAEFIKHMVKLCSFFSGTEVIVAGGMVQIEDDIISVTTTTEIFNIGTGKWRNGKIVDQ